MTMVQLTLVGVSEDRTRLLLVDDSGTEFTLAITQTLHAALRGDHARLGQLEFRMDSALRPREIQSRIRAGESAESVAQAAQTTVDQIMGFAGPVLAERVHMADRAQRSSLRRPTGDTGARTLGDAVAGRLREHNIAPESVDWDSWRRDDGRWALSASYRVGKKRGTARFVFDPPGNYVVTDNDDASWLVGDVTAAPEPDPAPAGGRARRLSAVPSMQQTEELPLGDDAIELVSDGPASAPPATPSRHERTGPQQTSPQEGTQRAAPTAPVPEQPVAAATPPHPEPEPEPDPDPPPRRSVRKKGGRASVPSWDEIMFGGGKPE